MSNKQEFQGWLGGQYDDFGFCDNQEDAKRGYMPSERIFEILGIEEFNGKYVKITIEEIEETK